MNEKLTITTSNPVRARFYEYPRFTYPWHFHSEYEIIYVEKGEGDCLVGDSIISYSKGDLILFGSELPHSMQSPPDDGEESDNEEKSELKVRGVNIQFEKDFMHYSISQYSQFIPIRNLLEDACRGIKFTITPFRGKSLSYWNNSFCQRSRSNHPVAFTLQMMAISNHRKYLDYFSLYSVSFDYA